MRSEIRRPLIAGETFDARRADATVEQAWLLQLARARGLEESSRRALVEARKENGGRPLSVAQENEVLRGL